MNVTAAAKRTRLPFRSSIHRNNKAFRLFKDSIRLSFLLDDINQIHRRNENNLVYRDRIVVNL